MSKAKSHKSSGHALGQQIGDWFEEYFVYPLLKQVGESLYLFVDSRFTSRSCRGSKIIWTDIDNNDVDYDAVLELGGSESHRGIPVAFLECCWRRGSRHSKDKARDDSGKLMPMRDTFPTARFLGQIVAGDFTVPARTLIISRGIDLFYVPKDKVIEAFKRHGLVIDYPDKLGETEKAELANNFSDSFTVAKKVSVQSELLKLIGKPSFDGYVDRVRSHLSALPQEVRFILMHKSEPVVFESVEEAQSFLDSPTFEMSNPQESYVYEITYSDGSLFSKDVASLDELRTLHEQITSLEAHMRKIQR